MSPYENLSQPGTIVDDRFKIERIAGSGGMSTVYRARDLLTDQWVALKILLTQNSAPQEWNRFVREAHVLAGLHHPGIVAYIAHGLTPQGSGYLAMEWLEGEDLGRRLARGPLAIAESVSVIQQAASALQVAHDRGIVHRDLKPRNVPAEESREVRFD